MGRFVTGCLSSAILLCVIYSSTTLPTMPLQQSAHAASPAFTPYESLKTDFSDYIWPTDAGRIVTSVFAEYRRTHFHGGIDISTGNETGFRVFASRNGYVSRIVVAPTGYGKMLWVRHADGYYTTYAHLRNFNDALDAFVLKEQLRLQQYPLDVECQPEDFPVKKWDVIAYSGETGVGSPHLHFEIRDPNKDFVNPLLCNQFTFPDDSLPRFYSLAVSPVGEHSYINSSLHSRAIEFRDPLKGSITLPETLHAFGSFGFAVDVRDRINQSRFNSGVYSHNLFLDDSLIYSVQFDRAPANDGFQVGLFYDFALMSDEGGRLAKLYADSPNRIPFIRPKTSNAGIINTEAFAEGAHSFRIVSGDFGKRSSELSGTVVFSRPPEFTFTKSPSKLQLLPDGGNTFFQFRLFSRAFSPRTRKDARWKVLSIPIEQLAVNLSRIGGAYDILKIEETNVFGASSFPLFYVPRKASLPKASAKLEHEVGSEYVSILLTTDGAFTSPPSVAVLEGTRSRTLKPIAVEYNFYTATFRPLESFAGKRTVIAEYEANGYLQTARDEFNIYPILPGASSHILVDGGRFHIIADSSSVYKPLFLEVQQHEFDESVRYSLLPRFAVVNSGITVKMLSRKNNTREAMYVRRTGSSWILETSEREGEFFKGEFTRTLGDVALLTDATPPYITRLSIPGKSKKQPHQISFRVHDNLSGVEYKELKLYIDGVFALPEIDGEHRRVVHRLAKPLPRGSHTLRILLKDRIGNSREISRTFKVR